MEISDEEILDEIFTEVRPYLTAPSNLREVIKETSKKSSNLKNFTDRFRKYTSKIEDPTQKADYRIFINKLESR